MLDVANDIRWLSEFKRNTIGLLGRLFLPRHLLHLPRRGARSSDSKYAEG